MVIREKQQTLETFEAFIAAHEGRQFELIHGEIVEKMPTEEHSLAVGNIYFALRMFVEPRQLGRVAFEVRHQIAGDERNSRLPDAEFTSTVRLLPIVTKGAVLQMPDLAVDVKSPDDSYVKLCEKAVYYLQHGSKLVWLVFPERQQIEVHTNDGPIVVLGIDDVLDGGDVLPGFQLPVKAVFSLQ